MEEIVKKHPYLSIRHSHITVHRGSGSNLQSMFYIAWLEYCGGLFGGWGGQAASYWVENGLPSEVREMDSATVIE